MSERINKTHEVIIIGDLNFKVSKKRNVAVVGKHAKISGIIRVKL